MILVTGGTGFVGRAVVDALLADGRAVGVQTRGDGAGLPARVHVQRIAAGRGQEPPPLPPAVTAVVNLGGALAGSASELHHANVEASAVVARAAAAAGVRRFVHVSSAGVYGEQTRLEPLREDAELRPRTAYERTKLEGEQAARDALATAGTEFVVLRPAGVYGGARAATRAFLSEVRARPLWVHAPPRVYVHPTYVRDVVGAIRAALDGPGLHGGVFNVGGAEPLAYDEWIRRVAAALGVRARQIVVPAGVVCPLAAAATRILRGARAAVPPAVARLARDVDSRVLDLGRLRRVLGVEPVPVDVALAETIREAEGGTR